MRSLALLKLKSELKLTAFLIRSKRELFRSATSQAAKNGAAMHLKGPGRNMALLELLNQLGPLQYNFRCRHIAYGMIRGKTLEQIESKGKRCNEERCTCYRCPDLKKVKEIVVEYMKYLAQEEVPSEALRVNSG